MPAATAVCWSAPLRRAARNPAVRQSPAPDTAQYHHRSSHHVRDDFLDKHARWVARKRRYISRCDKGTQAWKLWCLWSWILYFLWQVSQTIFLFSIIGEGTMIPRILTIGRTNVSCKLGKKNLNSYRTHLNLLKIVSKCCPFLSNRYGFMTHFRGNTLQNF